MNKSELIARTAQNTGMTKKDTERVVNAALEAIMAAMACGEKVQLSGFGTFFIQHREARTARNPRTGEPMVIPPTDTPAFKPSQALRELITNE